MNQVKRTMLPRISLSTLMLLIVALAIGLASRQMGRSIERAETEVYPMRYLANELRVQRPNEYVVVGHFATKMGELNYSVHIPDDGEHELCLAVGEVPRQGIVEASQRIGISPGVHRVELKIASAWQAGATVVALVDDREVISVDAPESWTGLNGSTGGLQYRTSTHFGADGPLDLVRQRFGSGSNKAVGPGVLLWIQPN